jgi:hypothetical protein
MKKPRHKPGDPFEFVYAEIVGCWSYQPETLVAPRKPERPPHVLPGQVGMLVRWGAKGYGFGEYKVRFFTDGTVQVEDERSGPEFTRQLFAYLGEQAAKGEHDREREKRLREEDPDGD